MGSSPVKDNGDVNPEGKTLYEYYKTKMPSLSDRATMYADFGGEGKYTGSASQNIKLLSQIKEKATKPPPSGNDDGNGGGDKSKNIIDKTVSRVGKVVESIGKFISSPNIDVTTGEGYSKNRKERHHRKYGTGEYRAGGSKAHFRMKSGESKFKYQRRMQKLKRTNPELFKTEE
jgi:hypothetical protein